MRELGGEREYLWDGPAGAVEVDRDVPEWFEPYPAVEMTEFAGWNEVARWAAPLFVSDPAAVQSIAARWRGLPEEERAARALAFVREEVRYFGMEVGVHAHKPHAPSLVLRRRFGDCKDKALLLVSLLQALGIEARPVLANTRLRRGLDDRLPSPYVFDHAIVRATVGGKERWFDATRLVLVPRLRFFDFVRAERRSGFVVTDSGGSQEECYYLDIPCLVHRMRTERREGLGENAVLSHLRIDALREFLADPSRYRRRSEPPVASPTQVIVDDLARRGFV